MRSPVTFFGVPKSLDSFLQKVFCAGVSAEKLCSVKHMRCTRPSVQPQCEGADPFSQLAKRGFSHKGAGCRSKYYRRNNKPRWASCSTIVAHYIREIAEGRLHEGPLHVTPVKKAEQQLSMKIKKRHRRDLYNKTKRKMSSNLCPNCYLIPLVCYSMFCVSQSQALETITMGEKE